MKLNFLRKGDWKRLGALYSAVLASVLTAGAADKTQEFPPQPAVPYLNVADSLKTFSLPEGYRLEPVLTEPQIKEPVLAVFDGNGRMYVAEMRTYMQDIDGSNSHNKVSRVSLHWSSKGDGNFDKHTVFIDNLLLPRMVLPLADGVLVGETDTNDIFLYRDTNGDGVADEKKPWYVGGPRGGNLEHQPSGLIWGMDNWLYTTYNAYRLRQSGTNVLSEKTGPNGGQWGLTQDDFGKPWYVNAGGERGPLNFQTPIVYGAFNTKDQFAPDYMEVFPLVGVADVQGGPLRFRPEDKTLNHFTATCGADVFRGDRLPADLRGDLLFAEPVGRLIRRTKIEVREGLTYLRNAYDKGEFIRSTDLNFRPINMVTAPDGTLYIVDMYRGIIQEGNWVREGSYLRKVVAQHQLDKNFGRGRIYRLVHKDFVPGPQPRMLDKKPTELVAHLAHPNGWWRDTAQKLLIGRADKSVVPALQGMARTHQNPLARIHALWTLEGLDAVDPALVRDAMKDAHPQVRVASIRVSESLYKKGDKSLVPDVLALGSSKDAEVALQALLTANLLKFPDSGKFIQSLVNANASAGVREIGLQILTPPPPPGRQFSNEDRRYLAKGEAIYRELCFACHGMDGKGMPVDGAVAGTTLAPPLGGSKTVTGHRDAVLHVLLKGLAGPVNGKTYEALMVPMESNDDIWIASVASYIRTSFGNGASLINERDVARVRAATKQRTEPWTIETLGAVVPQPLGNRKQWKLTASHKTNAVLAAIDGNMNTRYDTGVSQTPGMWFQVELPQETLIAGLQLDAASSTRDYPRGYKVELSTDGQTWSQPVATGAGNAPLTEITFAPAKAKFIRITQTGAVNGLFWSIHELEVLLPSGATSMAGKGK